MITSVYKKIVGQYLTQGEDLLKKPFSSIADAAFVEIFLTEALENQNLYNSLSLSEKIAYFFGKKIIQETDQHHFLWDWSSLLKFLLINLPRLALFLPRFIDLSLHKLYLQCFNWANEFYKTAKDSKSSWKKSYYIVSVILRFPQALAFALHMTAKISFLTLNTAICPLASYQKAKEIHPLLGVLSLGLSVAAVAVTVFFTAGGSIIGQGLLLAGNGVTASQVSSLGALAIGSTFLGGAITAGRMLLNTAAKKLYQFCFGKKERVDVLHTQKSLSPKVVQSPKEQVNNLPPKKTTDRTFVNNEDYLIPLDQLKAEKELGKGGFGIVYQAKWQSAPVPVALKKIKGPAVQSEDLKREAKIHAKLRHPNIVTFYGVAVGPKEYALVLELMECSLRDLLQRDKALSWKQKLQIALGALSGLVYLHGRMLHRDLKSANILMDANNNAKLADFGLSTIINKNTVNSDGMTAGPMGTPYWMAPELFKNESCSKNTDIYSMTIVLWEILTGQLPRYTASTLQGVIRLVLGGARPEIPKETPEKYAELLGKGWAAKPSDRPSAQKMAREIESQLQALP